MKKIVNSNNKKIFYGILIWIFLFAVGLVKKPLENDTFYTIKIGKLILNNGIDMLDHFSFHNIAYTYPHWLYDVFIYFIYRLFGYTGMYISSIVLFLILLFIMFKLILKFTNNYTVSICAMIVCSLAIANFVTARAQLVSYILFALEIFFLENFIKKNNKLSAIGLILVSLLLANIHVAVWPFFFILFLPYVVEGIISLIKKKVKKKNKVLLWLDKKFVTDDNINIKYLLLIMLICFMMGLLTPIGDTPYTYLIKTMQGNSQKYIEEHQMLTWLGSPFTIIMAVETIFFAILSKIKIRDLLLMLGLALMSVMSIRHISLLGLIGSFCFARTFTLFLEHFEFNLDKYVLKFLTKKIVIAISYIIVLIFACITLTLQNKKDLIDKEFYPTDAVKYIKENIDVSSMRIFNEYNFGSYLLYNDIPVFIDSRADLYTKQFSGLDYDIFDDYKFVVYPQTLNFYNITHILIYKKSVLYNILKNDNTLTLLYEDDYFVFYERGKI